MNFRRYVSRFFVAASLFLCLYYAWLSVFGFWMKQGFQKNIVLRLNISGRRLQVARVRRGGNKNEQTKSLKCNRPAFLVILVFSVPQRFEGRSVIRSTWAEMIPNVNQNVNNPGNRTHRKYEIVKTVFLLGRPSSEIAGQVATEAALYRDMVVGYFTDTYSNLTYKTKLGFMWVYTHCHFRYLLKTDDDVFINIRGMVRWLWSLPRKNLYTGRCNFNSIVVRTKGHKWAIAKEVFKRDVYPPYCLGMGYIMSSDVFHKIMKIIHRQPYFPLEDVFVGLMIEKLNITPVDNQMYFHVRGDYSGDVCQMKDLLLSHYANARQMLQLHLQFMNVSRCD